MEKSQIQKLLETGFNGAVTFSLRKSDNDEMIGLLNGFRFNGAVTFSLRKLFHRSRITYITLPLQWGRNFFVTEIIEEAEEALLSYAASMGP